MWIAERISTSSLSRPIFNLCCQGGVITLPDLHPTPPELAHLLRGTDARAREFRKHIRAYNNSLSFTSLGVQLDQSVANSQGGAYNFHIHGSVYHCIGSLLPNAETDTSRFAQIYVHDPATQLKTRQAVARANVRAYTLEELQAMMYRINPFIPQFITAAEHIRSGELGDVAMVISAENTPDARHYNVPSESEIGVLIVENDDVEANRRDIVLGARSNELQFISEMHRLYDALHYVLIFPEG